MDSPNQDDLMAQVRAALTGTAPPAQLEQEIDVLRSALEVIAIHRGEACAVEEQYTIMAAHLSSIADQLNALRVGLGNHQILLQTEERIFGQWLRECRKRLATLRPAPAPRATRRLRHRRVK